MVDFSAWELLNPNVIRSSAMHLNKSLYFIEPVFHEIHEAFRIGESLGRIASRKALESGLTFDIILSILFSPPVLLPGSP